MYYKLVDKVVTPCSIGEWAEMFEGPDRILAKDTVNGLEVSTVFLGTGRSSWNGDPIVFETMIFGLTDCEYQVRYCTWDQAVEGHLRALKYALDYQGPLA